MSVPGCGMTGMSMFSESSFFLNLLFFRAGRPPSPWELCGRGSAVRGASLTDKSNRRSRLPKQEGLARRPAGGSQPSPDHFLRAFLHGHGIGGFCYGHRTCGSLCSIGGRGGDDYPSSVAAHAPMAIIMATSVSIYRCFHNRYVRLKVTTVKR